MELRAYLDKQIASRPIEARLIRKVVNALANAGNPVVSVWDGEEWTDVTTTEEVVDLAFNLDELTITTRDGGGVFLVMGNEWDIISDYNVSLEDALKPVSDYIQKNW